MLYRKNIYRWEQWSRVVLGAGLAVWGLVALAQPLGIVVALGGVGLALTGVLGWCPACAMVGRRIREKP